MIGVAPTSLNEGDVVEVVLADLEGELPEQELAALNDALDESWEQLESGDEVSAEDAIELVSRVQ